jgi:hypothetical protein
LLYKRPGKKKSTSKKWKTYYFNLIGGSLHYYKQMEDDKPKSTIELSKFSLQKEGPPIEGTNYLTFILKNDSQEYLFAADDKEDFQGWLKSLEAAKSKPPSPPLTKEKKKSRVASLAQKTKKNVGGKLATSKLGKRALKANAPEEITNLVSALKTIVEKESGSKQKAVDVEKNIFKIGVKIYFIIDAGKLTLDDFLVADKPLRAALELLSKCHDHAKYSRHPKDDLLKEKLLVVEGQIKEAASILTNLLKPHLQAKNVQRIDQTVALIGTADFLFKILKESSLEEEVQELINAGEHYTGFHFYPESK